MNESEHESGHGRCDFCQTAEAKFTINGGLWWLCPSCMEKEYESHAPVGEEE